MYLHCMRICAALYCSPMPVFCSTAPKIAQHVNVPFSIFEVITVGISQGNKTEIENSGTVLKPSAKWKRWQFFFFFFYQMYHPLCTPQFKSLCSNIKEVVNQCAGFPLQKSQESWRPFLLVCVSFRDSQQNWLETVNYFPMVVLSNKLRVLNIITI